MIKSFKAILPNSLRNKLSLVNQGLKRANITQSFGLLNPFESKTVLPTFIMAVGSAFNQDRPDAMMTCRMGYCNAFEALGIPYLIVDIRDLKSVIESVNSPFVMYFAGDIPHLPAGDISVLRNYPSAVWVYPWFHKSDEFFAKHNLDSEIWTLDQKSINKILKLEPVFGFTATTISGLHFFEKWKEHGVPVKSYPLACDTSIYKPNPTYIVDFEKVELAFVGGYWKSKGFQLDAYLRPLEDKLTIYGYSKWPYKGYHGMLPASSEASLYHQALVCPVINEPTVALLHGQINERVFKVLGSGGCPIVDAVPAYRELFLETELLVANSPNDFLDIVRELLINIDLNLKYRQNGMNAVLGRHTYKHRAKAFMHDLNINN